MITYDENGGYGHPDHIRAHQVAVGGFEAAGDPGLAPEAGEPWRASKLYYTAMPKSVIQRGIDQVPGVRQRHRILRRHHVRRRRSLRGRRRARDHGDRRAPTSCRPRSPRCGRTARRSPSTDPFFALADNEGQQAFGVEYFRLIQGETAPGPTGREDDLFAGLDV